jgi:hypothetical protein
MSGSDWGFFRFFNHFLFHFFFYDYFFSFLNFRRLRFILYDNRRRGLLLRYNFFNLFFFFLFD